MEVILMREKLNMWFLILLQIHIYITTTLFSLYYDSIVADSVHLALKPAVHFSVIWPNLQGKICL